MLLFALSYASIGRQLFSDADKLKLWTVSSKLYKDGELDF